MNPTKSVEPHSAHLYVSYNMGVTCIEFSGALDLHYVIFNIGDELTDY